jgi:hypothetical protein
MEIQQIKEHILQATERHIRDIKGMSAHIRCHTIKQIYYKEGRRKGTREIQERRDERATQSKMIMLITAQLEM